MKSFENETEITVFHHEIVFLRKNESRTEIEIVTVKRGLRRVVLH